MVMRILLILTLCILSSCAQSAKELVILHMNDTHSHIDPEKTGKYAGRGGVFEQAMYIDSVRAAAGKNSMLLLHAGDFSQGTSYFTELQGNIEIDILNAMGFDAVCLGNHEFDNGIEELARRLGNLDVPVVCANYDFKGSALENLVHPYVVIRKAGLKIGVIGLLTDVSSVVDGNIAAVMKFMDPVEITNKYAEMLKHERGCDLVICLTHLGYENEPFTDVELAAVVRNVDIIVGGHSHTKLTQERYVKDLDGKDVIIVTDWKWGFSIGKLDVSL